MRCFQCGFEALSSEFPKKHIMIKEDSSDNLWRITKISKAYENICPSCKNHILSGNKSLLRIHREIKVPEGLDHELAKIASGIIKKKRITLQDAQKALNIVIPADAIRFLESLVRCGILDQIEYPSTLYSDSKLLFIVKNHACSLIQSALGEKTKTELFNERIIILKNRFNNLNFGKKITDSRLEIIQTILQTQINLLNSKDINKIQLKDDLGNAIASFIHGTKYNCIILILIQIYDLLLNKKYITTQSLAENIDFPLQNISRYREEIERLLGFNLRYGGILRINNSNKQIGRLQLSDEYQKDILEFESDLRDFLINCFITISGQYNAYKTHIEPIDPSFSKKGKPRKTFVMQLKEILERDIKRALLKKEKGKIKKYKRDLREIKVKGFPISKNLLLRLLDQLNYKDYPQLLKNNWNFLILKNNISYNDFIKHLDNIRINRIDLAHIKESENELIGLNESLYLLRTAIDQMPSI